MPAEFITLHGLETEMGTSSRTIIINISSRTEQTEQSRAQENNYMQVNNADSYIYSCFFLLTLSNDITN